MEVKRNNGYECPVCHKVYLKRGKYLTAHLAKCKAIAWNPKTIFTIKMNKVDEDKLANALDMIINGKFISSTPKVNGLQYEFERAKKEYQEKIDNAIENANNCIIERGSVNDYTGVMSELKTYFADNNRMII